MGKGLISRAVLAFMGAMALSAGVGCQTNPTTGRNQLILLSRDEEIALGTESKPELIKEFGGETSKSDVKSYVTAVGGRLAAQTRVEDPQMADLPWEFTVLDSDVINAFALPGGKVFITTGLMKKMTNEAQLAAVLGHEIGHVTARHTNERYSRAAGAQLGLSVGGVLVGGESGALINQLASQATELALMKYGRDQESEADLLGARYMVRLNYDPMGAVQVMEILQKESEGSNPPEILSTHPDPGRRAEALRKEIAEKYANTQNNPSFTLHEQEFRNGALKRLSFRMDGERFLAWDGVLPAGAIGVLMPAR